MDDGENDWDLGAVVRSCSNLNGNSSRQDVHDGGLPSQTYDSIPLLYEDHGSAFPSIVTERRNFGLEEVIDRFTSGKMRESVTPAPQSLNPYPTRKPQQPLPNLQIGSRERGGGLGDETLPHQVEEVNEVEMLVEKVQVPVEKVDEWDGWVWRKYGTKMVNDSPHPKSYYRCNHVGKNCPAKKHIQLNHMDESKYIITYRGNHNHPPSIQNTTTKPRKSRARARVPAPPAAKGECSIIFYSQY